MPRTINEMVSAISKADGFARLAQFEVEIFLPPGIGDTIADTPKKWEACRVEINQLKVKVLALDTEHYQVPLIPLCPAPPKL